jgi:DNA-binding transcriptional regulator YdaS (Cro superfamily)
LREEAFSTVRSFDVAAVAERLQNGAALLLYGRLISPGGPAKVAAIAELLGVGPSTVYRQCSGEIPVQLRTLVPLAALDFEGLKALLDRIASDLGVTWVWSPEVSAAPSGPDALEAVTEVSLVCSEAAVLEVASVRDGAVTPQELAQLERKWVEEDYKREQMRAQIRAMASRGQPRAAHADSSATVPRGI